MKVCSLPVGSLNPLPHQEMSVCKYFLITKLHVKDFNYRCFEFVSIHKINNLKALSEISKAFHYHVMTLYGVLYILLNKHIILFYMSQYIYYSIADYIVISRVIRSSMRDQDFILLIVCFFFWSIEVKDFFNIAEFWIRALCLDLIFILVY